MKSQWSTLRSMQIDRFTIKSQEALKSALALAPEHRHPQVSPLHLLAALLDQEGGLVVPVLSKIGVSADALRADVRNALGELPTLASEAEPTTSPELLATLRAAEREGRDLTEEARDGDLDPVIVRDDEIRRVIQVLSRRTKNNPVLIGEPGVG